MAINYKKIGKRWKYLNDFVEDENGNYKYVGRVYRLLEEGTTLRREITVLWLLFAAALVCHLAAGCLPVSGMLGTFYVVLPYSFVIFGLGFWLWALTKLMEGRREMREYIYNSYTRLPMIAKSTALAAAITILGEIIYILIHGFEGKAALTLLLLVLLALPLLFALLTWRRAEKQVWKAQ